VILENERNHVGINDNFGHAAGPERLWPRHSRSVSRIS
jgi:hypothetical protein